MATGWIQTYTGRQFWPLNPNVNDICIEDIAHALSMKCRYTGHTMQFYSVAQHSLIVSEFCEDPQWGLMHDALEAYLPDVAHPIKHMLPGFELMEATVAMAIARRYGLSWPMPECLHRVDRAICANEKRDVCIDAGHDWDGIDDSMLLDIEIIPEPSIAITKMKFLDAFAYLFPNEV